MTALCSGALLFAGGRSAAQEPPSAAEHPSSASENPYDGPPGSWEDANTVEPAALETSPAVERADAAAALPDPAQPDPAPSGPAQPDPAPAPAVGEPAEGATAPAKVTAAGSPELPEDTVAPGAHRVTAIVLTGLSFLGVGVGTSYAIQSTSRNREAARACTPVCSAAGERFSEQARESATVSQIAFAVGLVSLGGAAYLWFTEPSSPTRAVAPGANTGRALQVDVAAGPGRANAWLSGRF